MLSNFYGPMGHGRVYSTTASIYQDDDSQSLAGMDSASVYEGGGPGSATPIGSLPGHMTPMVAGSVKDFSSSGPRQGRNQSFANSGSGQPAESRARSLSVDRDRNRTAAGSGEHERYQT